MATNPRPRAPCLQRQLPPSEANMSKPNEPRKATGKPSAPPKSKTSTASRRAASATAARSATVREKREVTSTPSSPAMQRADELLRQMTVEEKAMQLSSVFPLALFDTEGTNHSQLDALLKNGIGHVSALGLIGHKTPEALAKAVNAIQRYLITETRLKIPAIFHRRR
jgi:hypothetical protein